MTKTTKVFNRHPLINAMAVAAFPLIAVGSSSVMAQDDAELEQLRERVQALESRLAGAVSTAPELSEENPYILREGDGLKIGDTTISFGGFIKADAIYGSNGNGHPNGYSVGLQRGFASAAATENDWKVGFTARESRFSFGTETEDVAGHTLRSYLEMDFNQSATSDGNEVVSNSYAPRLRQAFANWNGWSFGQTYTTFSDLAAMPEILDQGKMAGFIYVTQPQLRYTMAAPGGKFMVALENPEDGFVSSSSGTNFSYDDQSYPDLTARYQFRGNYGIYSVAGMVRNLEDDASDDTDVAGAVSLSARIPTFGRDDLRLQYNYGALGRYMGLYAYPDVDLAAQLGGEVEALETFGATAAYRHFWSPSWRSSVTVSHTEIVSDLDNKVATPVANGTLSYYDASTSVHANLLWSAHKNLTLGLEYAYWDFGRIESQSSEQYEQVMASAKVSF